MNELIVTIVDGEPRVDSRLIAAELGVEHKNTRELFEKYSSQFQEFGILPFQTEEIRGRGQPEKFYILNEDQCYFLMTLVRNTEQAVVLKKRLVHSFAECRKSSLRIPTQLELAREVVVLLEQKEVLERELVIARPKAEFHDEVTKGAGEFTLDEVCATLFNRAVKRADLSGWLVRQNWLIGTGKRPTAWAIDRGLMRLRPDFVEHLGKTFLVPVVTGKGLTLLRHLYRRGELFTADIPAGVLLPQPEQPQ